MTARRQENKGHRPRIAVLVTAILGIAMSVVAMSAFSGGAGAATNERVVVDRYTGLAISGYDPVDAARGVIIAGRFNVWLISGSRLYLFSREENRDAFAGDPSRFAAEAAANWPHLKATLSDY
jgi:hypothetical protein